jgi:hypothetical protein
MKYSTWSAQTLPAFARFTHLLLGVGKNSYCLVMQLTHQTILPLRWVNSQNLANLKKLKDRWFSSRLEKSASVSPQKYQIGDTVKFMPTGSLGVIADAKYQPLFYAGEPISPRWMYLLEGVGDRCEWISEYTLNDYK